MKALIAPSLLAANPGCLSHECKRMSNAGADWLHIDIMDGHFVPNLSYFDIKSIRESAPDLVLDCHMMVSNPSQWIEMMKKGGGDSYTFHIESVSNPAQIIKEIKDAGMRVGCALKPNTPISVLDDIISSLDMVLIMTVEPGFGGQKFMSEMMTKVSTLRQKYPDLDVQVDGGLSLETIDTATSAGANVIVAGTGIFKSDDAKKTIEELRRSVIQNLKL